MALRPAISEKHLGDDSKEVVRLATGMIVTMSGLVLGMLVSSANSYYEMQKSQVASLGSQVIVMDSLLKGYGPEAAELRTDLRSLVQASFNLTWPSEGMSMPDLRPTQRAETLIGAIETLTPATPEQSSLKGQLVALAGEIRQNRWLMFLKSDQNTLPLPLLIVVVSWIVATFVSFGLFAPANVTVVATMGLSAVAVSAAIFIILELYSPFSGVLRVSSAPIRDVLNQMGH